ncbi:hypothetical protein L6452_21268 [Arctium lappa]|uniref:Uncharacterized protein n=1 Tax=Arctium lappa TaxID=4217 RepID=A0ACB9BCV5_ARCLA|nr:hypothetical protein L6452_21268 [Arctium lappa]
MVMRMVIEADDDVYSLSTFSICMGRLWLPVYYWALGLPFLVVVGILGNFESIETNSISLSLFVFMGFCIFWLCS